MSLRCARSTVPAVLALVAAVSTVLAGVIVPTAGAGGASQQPMLSLVSQSAWVQPAPEIPATLGLVVAAASGVPRADEVVTTLYGKLHTRSGFEQALTHTPSRYLDRTHPVALSALPPDDGGGKLTVSIWPSTPTTAPADGPPTLVLTCTPLNGGTCTGVYPLVVSLVRPAPGGGTTPVAHGRFTTYLTYAATSAHRLDFTLVVPVAAPVRIHTGVRDPARAVAAPSAATTRSLAGLVTSLGAHPDVPVTVAASPQTLQALDRPAARREGGPQAVQALATMSTTSPLGRQFLAQPYVPVDLGALAAGGEGEEIVAQMQEGTTVLKTLKIQTTVGAPTWVATGTVGSALLTGMATAGATRLVVPDDDLAPPPDESGTWASDFTLSAGKAAPVTAAASDGELAAHFTAHPGDPALEATQLLADLAMIHFEEPNTASPRGVVAVPPAGWVPTRAFDTTLLAGLTTDPVVQATTLGGYFASFAKEPAAPVRTRRLAIGGVGPSLARSLARAITAQRLRLSAFVSAVRGPGGIRTQLAQLLLAAEADALDGVDEAAGVATFGRALDAQLSLVQLATERAITLTARSGPIPVTIVSTAPYTVVGILSLTGGRFLFPHGSTQRLRLDHPTNPVRIDVEARTSGDLPLEVTFRAPTGNLVIARGQLTVRSTATSFVGVVLTALALLVLLGWWARTWRRGRRRRASLARGASGA